MTNEERIWDLLGKVIAYESALDLVLVGHPHAHVLQRLLGAAKEAGTAQLLAEVTSDRAIDSFERAMDKIAAKLTRRLG